MDDRFVRDHSREPRPEYARRLRARLDRVDETRAARAFPLRPVLATAAAVAAVAALFAFPSVRASAQAFLELFRVRQFAVVQFDAARLEKLRALEDRDQTLLVFDERTVLRDPGPPRMFTSMEEAAAATGLPLRRVTWLAEGLAPDSVWVEGEVEAKFTMNGPQLRALLDELGLHDVQVPAGFDGRPVQVRRPVVVAQRYRAPDAERVRATLVQAGNPEVGLPPGADLAQLGEVGLRVLGLDPVEARRVAGSIDWRTTLVVPVPLDASSFRPVTIHGNEGLLVTCRRDRGHGDDRHDEGTIVMWSDGDRIFALTTTLHPPDAVAMAESVQ